MDIHTPLPLLAGLSPQQFMKRHWQKKPLLIRQAVPGFKPVLNRSTLFELAAREGVESRLVVEDADRWRMRQGPFSRRALPPLSRRQWTLLVQGVDLHHEGAHDVLQAFRFVPDARLDDLMISYASDGGGVGPHFDSYDVFLLQAHGQRRWRIGRQKDFSLRDDVPLKILANFEPEEEFVLEPGDMLYLPPRYAHDGVAVGECMTYSIGFRAPSRGELATELLPRLAEDMTGKGLYRDPSQLAATQPARIPDALQAFAAGAVASALRNQQAIGLALGEYLTEPKANVWFDGGQGQWSGPSSAQPTVFRLDRRTRMVYDATHVFINGDGYRAGGRDAATLHRLANARFLSADSVARLGPAARDLFQAWCEAGWIQPG